MPSPAQVLIEKLIARLHRATAMQRLVRNVDDAYRDVVSGLYSEIWQFE
jgi:hypothetical protein